MNNEDRILLEKLLRQLESLRLRQDTIQSELDAVELSIKRMVEQQSAQETSDDPVLHTAPALESSIPTIPPPVEPTTPLQERMETPPTKKKSESNLEKFIGENLISKVGIAITILGVSFGAKYAIDHGILSPQVRILLGYLLGGSLMFLSWRLKEKFPAYSAVLNGGSFAVFYLVTFFAYSAYGFIPQALAFIIMVLLTAGIVYSAMRYDSMVLAQIGMVGAYSVPFLLSDHSGRVVILFSYIALINVGILVVAFLKSWKFLFYSSFVITWIIFGTWAALGRKESQNDIAHFFLLVFTLIFWITFLSGAWLRREKPGALTIIVLALQMLLFFVVGSSLYDHVHNGMKIFMPQNMLLPAISFYAFRRIKAEDGEWLLTFFIGATLFLIGTWMVWFDDQWQSIALSLLGASFMFTGRRLGRKYFEVFSYAIFFIALLSLCVDWMKSNNYLTSDPDYRGGFAFASLTTLASLVMIGSTLLSQWWINLASKEEVPIKGSFIDSLRKYWSLFCVAVIYLSLRVEVSAIWVEKYHTVAQVYESFAPDMHPGLNVFRKFENLSLIAVSAIFLMILLVLNIRKIHSLLFGRIYILGTVLTMLTFLTSGLYALRYLRSDHLNNPLITDLPDVAVWRYGIIMLLVALVILGWFQAKRGAFKPIVFVSYDCISHVGLLWVLTSELIRILEIYQSSQVYKLGLTILWGAYALMLVVLGIMLKRKHIRVMGITIFGVTLIKLLVYDLDHLSTIAKAGLFLLIGAFMLLVSYLYLKFRKKIFGDEN